MYFCGVSFEITKILKSPICAGTLKMRGKNPLNYSGETLGFIIYFGGSTATTPLYQALAY